MGNELKQKIEHLKATCTELGIPLVRAGIHGLLDTCHLDLDETDFFALLPHEKPSAVFYETVAYDPERFIRGTMIAQGWKEGWEKDRESIWPTPDEIKAELQADLANAADQIGLPRSLMATYTIQGQHRVCWLTAEWAEDLSEKIDEILESRHERSEEASNKIARTLESLIEEVANDPDFKAIRGRPKKLLFLQKKYGARIPPHPRHQLARPAQNSELVDQNVAIVLTKADERAWSEKNLD